MNPQAYHTWFSSVFLQDIDTSVCKVAVPNAFFIEMMSEPYAALIRDTIAEVSGQPIERVEFVISDGVMPPVFHEESAAKVGAAPVSVPVAKPTPLGAPVRRSSQQANLNPRYVFDQFVVGAGNQFAHAAAKAVADKPAKAYNPPLLWR